MAKLIGDRQQLCAPQRKAEIKYKYGVKNILKTFLALPSLQNT